MTHSTQGHRRPVGAASKEIHSVAQQSACLPFLAAQCKQMLATPQEQLLLQDNPPLSQVFFACLSKEVRACVLLYNSYEERRPLKEPGDWPEVLHRRPDSSKA